LIPVDDDGLSRDSSPVSAGAPGPFVASPTSLELLRRLEAFVRELFEFSP
jgi:hypothetical protein